MLKRIFITVIFSSILEIFFYNIFVQALWRIGLIFHQPISRNILWGLTILHSIYVFSTVVLIKNIAFEFFKTNNLVSNLIALIVFSILIEEKSIPLRTLLLIISALLVLTCELVIKSENKNLNKNSSNLS